jgi:hypothetical protein
MKHYFLALLSSLPVASSVLIDEKSADLFSSSTESDIPERTGMSFLLDGEAEDIMDGQRKLYYQRYGK